ncbi:PE domain-containing protein, partial [Mycobacterium szulgai]|uniref:PE domain-containing protein n=1 Tax=Mycobacterium szulgai TaxID=1787 RepID=UPI00111C24F3
MSFLIADPVTVSAAAANLEDIGSALRAANLSSPTAVAAAAADEVSTAIAALFGTYAQDYRVLSAQAASFHARFVRALSAGAGWYASAEAVNGSLVQQVEQQALNLVNGPAKAMLGRPLFGNGADATVAGSRGADGGLIFGNGGNGAAGDNGQPGGAGGNAGWFGNGGAGGAGGAGAPGGNGGNGGQLVGNGGNGGPGGQAVAGLNGANPGLGGLGGTAGLFGHPGSNGQVGASATDVTPSQPPGSTDGGGGTGPGGGTGTGLDATYTVTSQWDTGYVAKYTVTNSGSTALGGWKVEFDLPQGESVTSAWGGQLVSNGTHYTVASEAGAQPIAPGQSFSVGFQVAQTGAYGAPTNAVVNGQPVTGGTTPTPPPVT